MNIDTAIRTPADCIRATYCLIAGEERRAFFLKRIESTMGISNQIDLCAIWAREEIGGTFCPKNDRAWEILNFVRGF